MTPAARKSFLFLIALALPALLAAPTLLWPHYGIFSDGDQIIHLPPEVLSNFPQSMMDFMPGRDGRWIPLFHILDIAIYAVSPRNPFIFYLFQYLILTVSVIVSYKIVIKMTNNAWFALASVVLFCISSGIFENYYTLDKVEPRLVVCCAVALWAAAKLDRLARFLSAKGILLASIQVFVAVLSIYSKETAIFIGAAFVAASAVLQFRKEPGQRRIDGLLVSGLIHLAVFGSFVVLYRVLSRDVMDYRYVIYVVDYKLISDNIAVYFRSSPEFVPALIFAVYWTAEPVISWFYPLKYRASATLVAASFAMLAYFSGICLWRWALEYYLLPGQYLTAIVLSASVWIVRAEFGRLPRLANYALGAALAVFAVYLVVQRLFTGYAIFSFDLLKDDLAAYLSAPKWYGQRFILPMDTPSSAELGVELKFFSNMQRPANHQVNIYNFWELPLRGRASLSRFDTGAGLPPSQRQLQLAASPALKDNFLIWLLLFGTDTCASADAGSPPVPGSEHTPEIAADSAAGEQWCADTLRPGDLVLAPFGSPLFSRVRARGVGLHGQTPEGFLAATPLPLEEAGQVSRGFGPLRMGWKIYRFTGWDAAWPVPYSARALEVLTRPENDIAPPFSPPGKGAASVSLGFGWYDPERDGSGAFRWAGKETDVAVFAAAPGHYVLSLDGEPLGLQPETLAVEGGSAPVSLAFPQPAGRHTIDVPVDVDAPGLRILHLTISGGPDAPPPGDPRLLKARFFHVGWRAAGAPAP